MIGKTLGHYQITDKLGEGGMGVVYKAQDLHLDRFVALKILPPEKVANPERKRRFVQEAKAASALNHPNIITIYDIDQADGIDFIAMEFVEGKTLHQLTRPAGLLPTEALKYAVAVADALTRAHTSGIVHRDLKPSNVMVRDDGLVKVLDFGLAKLTEAAASGPDTPTRTLAPLSSEGLAVGTVGYMSPEQIESKHVDRRSDIFSFGVLLYEMLTGRRAFQGDSDLAILANILRETPPPLEGVPAGLAAVIGRCLRKDPVERFQSASDLRAVLEALQCMPSDEQKPPSIAVLPFADLSPDRENEYFSDGLTEELINALAQLPELQVTARTSAFSFKGKDLDVRTIGARLNVDHVLEGSVRRAGNRIRVTAQLIKAADGFHLWSERFDRDMTDVFAVQDEITEAVVDKLRVRLADGRPRAERQTEDLEAYDLYLKGRHQFYRLTDESLARGRQHLEEAIARAPDYAPAYTVLVAIYNTMAVFGPMSPGEALARTRAAATRALKLDGTLGEPHAALGLVHAVLDHNWNNAEREFRLALELDPSSGLARYWYAFFFLAPMLRLPEAIEEMRRVLEIDPLSPFYNVMLGLLLCWQRRHEEAIQQLRSALELDPHHHLAYAMLGITYMAAGTFDQAVAVLEKSVQFGGRNCQSLGFLGAAYAAAGRGDDARKLISELLDRARKAYSPPIAVAQIYLGLGEIDQAFAWLDRAVEDHESRALWLKPSPVYESVRSDPRYRELLRRMNFPQ